MKAELKIIMLLTVFISAIAFNGCDYTVKKSVSTTGEITIGVDEGISPVVKEEALVFMRLNSEAKVNLIVKTTKEVIADLNNGTYKTVVVGRDLTKEEADIFASNKIEIKKSSFARDGIGVIVNPRNPVVKLNYNELKRIFSGEQKEWSELDGDNKDLYSGKIKVYITRKNASIHDVFKQKVLAGAEFGSGDIICSTSSQMMSEIKSNENAIGFISMAWITVSNDTLDESVKPLKIAEVDTKTGAIGNYVGLHQGYIANKTYPLISEVYIFTTDFSMNLSVGFSSFMASYDGQRIVLKSGLVPVTQPVKIIQLN